MHRKPETITCNQNLIYYHGFRWTIYIIIYAHAVKLLAWLGCDEFCVILDWLLFCSWLLYLGGLFLPPRFGRMLRPPAGLTRLPENDRDLLTQHPCSAHSVTVKYYSNKVTHTFSPKFSKDQIKIFHHNFWAVVS